MATQFGKPSTIKEDYIIRNSENWYKKSPLNHPWDLGMCAYTQLLRVMAHFHEEIYSDPSSPTGLNQSLDFREVTVRHDELLERYFAEWTRRFQEDTDLQDPACAFRASLLPFLTNYSRLVMYSFGFQQAYKRGVQQEDRLFLDKVSHHLAVEHGHLFISNLAVFRGRKNCYTLHGGYIMSQRIHALLT